MSFSADRLQLRFSRLWFLHEFRADLHKLFDESYL
jgi:hypothetical protein